MICVFVNIIFLLGMVAYVRRSKGLIRTMEIKGSARPNVSMALLILSFGLALRALLDVNMIEISKLLLYAGVITTLGTFLYLYDNAEIKLSNSHKWLVILWTILWIGASTYGSLVILNKELDESPSLTFHTSITGKHVNSGKSTTYYIEFKPWDPLLDIDDITVSRDEYENYIVGQTIAVKVKKGFFNFRWFYIVGNY